MPNNNTVTGVYPCYENQFGIKTGESVYSTIADCESFSLSIDGNVEEWRPFDQQGWRRALVTGKAISISVTAKRNVGDTGNDAVAALWDKTGRAAEKDFQWTFPDGTVVLFADAVINVTNIGAGDSTGVAPLEFEVLSNGKPTVTPAA